MRRNNLTPCYHVYADGAEGSLCGTKNPFWQAIVVADGTVVAWEPWRVGFLAADADRARLHDDLICGRCARILKSRKAEVDEQEKERADEVATEVYNKWIRDNGLDFDEADYS